MKKWHRELIDDMIMDDEGGWRFTDYDHPTFAGVTLQTFRMMHPKATAGDLRAASQDAIRGVYWKLFLDPLTGLQSVMIPAVFSAAVNMGTGGATRALQHSIRDLSPWEDWIAVDGALGPLTEAALERVMSRHGSNAALTAFVIEWMNQYIGICESNPNHKRHLKGWCNRARRYLPRSNES